MSDLPPFLDRTPEQLEAERRRQQIAREQHLKGARQSRIEVQVARGRDREHAIRANLVEIQPETDLHRDTIVQLADALAEQGRYAEAAELDPQWRSTAEAIERDDGERCDCTDDADRIRVGNTVQEIEIPHAIVAGEIFSDRHGGPVSLIRCVKCGHENAVPNV